MTKRTTGATRRTVLKGVAASGTLAASGALAPLGLGRMAHAQAKKAGKTDKVTLGIGLSAPFSPYVIFVDKGFAAKHGITAEYRIFESGIQGIEAVVTGNAHVATGSEITTLRPRASGGKVLAVGRPLISGKDIGIGTGPKIQKPEDFKGKKVGMIPGSTGEYLFDRFTKKHGLPQTGPDAVTTVGVQAPEWIPAVQRGDIDAFFGWEPWLTKLPTIVKGARLYAYSGEDDLYTMWYTLLFREDWVREDPDSAGAVYKGLVEAVAWINANFEEATQHVSRVFKVPLADMRTQMQGSTFVLDTKKIQPPRIKEMAAWAKDRGIIKVDDVNKLVDDFYYPDLAKKYSPETCDF